MEINELSGSFGTQKVAVCQVPRVGPDLRGAREIFLAEKLETTTFYLSPHYYVAVQGLAAAWNFTASRVVRTAILLRLQRELWSPESEYAPLFEQLWNHKARPGPRDAHIIEHLALRPPDPSVVMAGMLMARAFVVRVGKITAKRTWDPMKPRMINANLTRAARTAARNLCEMHIYESLSEFFRGAVSELVCEYVSPYFIPSKGGYVARERGFVAKMEDLMAMERKKERESEKRRRKAGMFRERIRLWLTDEERGELEREIAWA